MSREVAVIGAGMTGLACARALTDAGWAPVVLDKGRAAGGRLGSRLSRSGWRFDHGAQFVTAREADFAALLRAMQAAGWADKWADGADEVHWVGVPDMGALARYLAQGLDVRQGVAVTALAPQDGGWRVWHDQGVADFARVVVTVPAPQVAGLLGAGHPLVARLAEVTLAPCLTLMAGLERDAPRPFVARRDEADELAWIARDSSKPGRNETAGAAWVAHASPAWSEAHLAQEPAALLDPLLTLLLERIGAEPASVDYATAHRWRYARVTAPLGQAFVRSDGGTLHLGGDWCLGPRVEAAWQSGRAIARDIVGA